MADERARENWGEEVWKNCPVVQAIFVGLCMHSSQVPCRLLSFPGSSGRHFSVVYGGLGRSVTREKSGTSRALLLLPMPSAKLPTKKKKDAWEPGYMNSFHSHSCCMISFYCKGFADNFFSNLPLLLPP